MKKWIDFLFRKFSEKHFKFHWVNVSYLSKKRFWQRTTFVMCYSRNLCWNISCDCFAESLQNQILKIFCFFSWLTFALTYVSLKAQIACRELKVYEIRIQNISFFYDWPLRWPFKLLRRGWHAWCFWCPLCRLQPITAAKRNWLICVSKENLFYIWSADFRMRFLVQKRQLLLAADR